MHEVDSWFERDKLPLPTKLREFGGGGGAGETCISISSIVEFEAVYISEPSKYFFCGTSLYLPS